jgi:ATP-dependent RNA helicase DDX35
LIERHPVLIITGGNGSSIVTEVPQFLYACGWAEQGYRIGVCTTNCKELALQVAQESGLGMGQVGYKDPFEKMATGYTRIVFMSTLLLLIELQSDPLLSIYSCVILDNVHERTIEIDILLGLLKKYLYLT